MAKERRAEAGAINIRLHPHEGEDHYVSLIKDVFKLQKSFASRGDQRLLISFLDSRKNGEDDLVRINGVIARFTDIQPNESWFNLKTNDEAEEEDVKQIKIPDHLKPNYKPFSFCFFPKKHKLVFELYSGNSSISHAVVATHFRKLFGDEKIREKYGEVNVDIVNDKRGLDEIFGIHTLKHLDILIDRPNPDDQEEDERRVLEKLNKQNAKRIEQKLTAVSGQSILPDKDTKILAKVALENGKIFGEGKDSNGKKVSYSSTKFPRIERHKFDPDTMSASDAFNYIALKFVR